MTERTKIIIVRHGESSGNLEQRVRGRTEFPLSKNGLAQAEAAAEALKNEGIECVYTSPLERALVTAQTIAAAGGFPLKTDERFNNMTFGPWEGRRKDDLEREFPNDWKIWITRPENLKLAGAESFDDARSRSVAALDDLVVKHAGKAFVIVSHRGLIKPLLCGVMDMAKPCFWKIYVDNASISVLLHSSEQGYTMTELNRTCHLAGLKMVEEYV